MADAVEPVVDTFDPLLGDVQHAAQPRMQKGPAHGSADNIAASNSARAAEKARDQRGDKAEMSLINQKAATGQQELVGHRQSDDAEYQQREDGDVPVSGDPL